MNNPGCIFIIDSINATTITNKDVIEIGSRNNNKPGLNLVTDRVLQLSPNKYIKTDYEDGENVDLVLNANTIVEHFGEASFDTLLSFEMLEHVEDWKTVITNMKRIIKPNGYIIATTRSYGFPLHEAPSDYWRYEIEDFINIFSDMKIEMLVRDWSGHNPIWNGRTWQIDRPTIVETAESIEEYLDLEVGYSEPGVFLVAKKPIDFVENNLDEIKLYNMLSDSRI